jgi:hypothetical protein
MTEHRANAVRCLVQGISFENDQAKILGRLVEIGVPQLLLDLANHPELGEINAFLRRKWNVAFLLSAIASLMGVSVRLTDPNPAQPVDAIAAHEHVSRIITDADGALCELRRYDAAKEAAHFERLLRPYRDMAEELDTVVVAAEILNLGRVAL